MAQLAASLKDNSYKISNVIKEGNKSLNELNTLADSNVTSIQGESKRLVTKKKKKTKEKLTIAVG